MIKINIDNEVKIDMEQAHYIDLEKRFKDKINKLDNNKYKKLKEYLYDNSETINKNRLKNIITGDIDCLKDIIEQIGEIKENKDYKPLEKLYLNFTSRKWSGKLLDMLNVRVCPYCNRQYTFTLDGKGIRPQFDHYFPKSKYPYLSVSLYNLVPSCSICNSKKSDLDTYKEENDIFYPYTDEFGYDVIFKTKIKDDFSFLINGSNKFDIVIESKNFKLKNKLKNLKEIFYIEDLYNQHKDYVIDIIKNAQIYNDTRINELLDEFGDIFNSKSDLINSIFMNNINKDCWGKRTLSKLTHDIYQEYNILNEK